MVQRELARAKRHIDRRGLVDPFDALSAGEQVLLVDLVAIDADVVGKAWFSGQGAGQMPTASAVLSSNGQ